MSGTSVYTRSRAECLPDKVQFWLERAGHCRYEIQRLPVNAAVKEELLKHSNLEGDHMHCWNESCWDILGKSSCVPIHSSSGCRCAFLNVNPSDLELCLAEGRVPLFTVDEAGEKSTIRMRSVNPAMLETVQYVAVSHARSQGLGNNRCNGLPHCSLSKVQSLVNQLFPNSGSNVSFSLDTLGLPIESQTRRQALSTAVDIFRGADKVLVLESFPHSMAIPCQIRESVWFSRVWTIWEGMLVDPSRLLFQLAKGPISLGEILVQEKSASTSADGLGISADTQEQELAWMIIALEHDMRIWSQQFNSTEAADRYLDKKRIYSAVRMACLSFSKFRILRNSEENSSCEAARKAVSQAYSDFTQRTTWKVGMTGAGVDGALLRLETLESLLTGL